MNRKLSFHAVAIFFLICFLSTLLFSCVPSEPPSPVSTMDYASLEKTVKALVSDIKKGVDFTGKTIQVSPNHFWERDTHMNLPFSSVLCDALTAELFNQGAVVSLQETDEKPMVLTGSYWIGSSEVVITVKLRVMGETASRDIAVVQNTMKRSAMDPRWLEPKVDRIARTLVRLLEENYQGSLSLTVKTKPFTPSNTSQQTLQLGSEFERYMIDALSASSIFTGIQQSSGSDAQATLNGDYAMVGSKMRFHAALESNNHVIVSSASFETDLKNIPQDLITPKIQSIDDLTQKITEEIIQGYLRNLPEKTAQEKKLLYIGKNSFSDTTAGAIIPLSLRLSQKFREQFSSSSLFSITSEPSSFPDLVLVGDIVQESEHLVVSAALHQVAGESSEKKCGYRILASAEGQLLNQFCKPGWHTADLKGKIDFLMRRLETKSAQDLPCAGQSSLVVNPFKYQDTMLFSQFSNYIQEYSLGYFADSRLFSPITEVEKRLARIRESGTRGIVTTQVTEAAVASLARASHYISGSYWQQDNGDIEVRAELSDVKGMTLASDHVIVDKAMINPEYLKLPQAQDKKFMEDIKTVANEEESTLSIELLTQKGRNNLSFKTGEEIIFLIKSNRTVYVNLYSRDAEGNIIRIFPNAYAGEKSSKINQGEVTPIPDSNYTDNFTFKVQGTTGNEMVFAFASDRPLPELSGSEIVHGMKQMSLSVPQIKAAYSEYAARRGYSLSWDSLPIHTRP